MFASLFRQLGRGSATLRFHDLRHTCAAFLIADGRHMEEVKAHLGHSSIRVTSDRYGHLFDEAQEAIRDGLDATFARGLADSTREGRSSGEPRASRMRTVIALRCSHVLWRQDDRCRACAPSAAAPTTSSDVSPSPDPARY